MAQRYSQNGWPAYPTTERYTRFNAGGQGWWAANDDVAVVFTEFIERFDAEVEELTGKVLDDWSYANRLVRGSATVVSNHGSATAIDLNALKHPRGVKNTFTKAQQNTMHSIKNSITDDNGLTVLTLGMDYTITVDDMHVEVRKGATRLQVKQAADKIRRRNELKLDREDQKFIKDTVLEQSKKAVIDWSDDETIRNIPLDPEVPEGAKWTFLAWAAASDKKADTSNQKVTILQEEVDGLKEQVATLTEMVAELLNRIPAPQ